MAERYAKLKDEWLLRGWTDMPRMLVNWTNGEQRELGKRAFYVARACDGNTDFSSLAFLPVHNTLLDKLISEGIAQECEPGDSIDAIQQYRIAENPRLKGLQWSVTGFCNLNCRHCYMESPSGRYGEMSFEDSVSLIGQFERANVHQIAITGGEPFLRKDMLDLLEVLARKRITVSQIYTNGLLITKSILEKIRGIGFSPSFQISFDGYGTHDYMRGTSGIEEGVIEAIRKVRAAGFNAVISTSVDRVSRECLADTYELLKKLDIQVWRLAVPQERGNWRGATTGLLLEDEAKIYEPLFRRWLEDGRPFSIEFGGFFRSTGHDFPIQDRNSDILFTPESFDCSLCREHPNILPDGTLLPCPGYTDSALQDSMPNVLRDGLPEALNQPLFRSIVDMRKSDLLVENQECTDCEWFAECGMGCRAQAFAETGSITAKDPVSCRIWKEGYRKRFQESAGIAD